MERMDFKSFCNAVVNGIAEYLLQYEIESIRLETVCHNNGVEHVGLVILLQGDYVSPTIYLEQYYQYGAAAGITFRCVRTGRKGIQTGGRLPAKAGTVDS